MEQTPKQDGAVIRADMRVELYQGGHWLLTGSVYSADGGQLIVRRDRTRVSEDHQPETGPVNLRCYDGRAPHYFTGRLAELTEAACRILDVAEVDGAKGREFFRLSLQSPAVLFSKGDQSRKLPMPCTLENVSAGGACFLSPYRYRRGATMQMQLTLPSCGAPFERRGVIVRREHHRGEYRYGLQFIDLTDGEIDELTEVILRLDAKRHTLR